MDLITRPLCQPRPNFWVLVSCVVIENQMDIQISWDTVIQAAQKREKLLMPVPGFCTL